MKSLDIIEAEHRSMARVASAFDALDRLVSKSALPVARAHAATVADLLGYVSAYVDLVHHAKEHACLHRMLRLRDPELIPSVDRLQTEHRQAALRCEVLLNQAHDFTQG